MPSRLRIPRTLRVLAFLLQVLVVNVAVIEVLSLLAALLFTLILGPDGPAFQEVAYLSQGVIVVPVLLLSGRFLERRSPAEVGFARQRVLQHILLGLALSGLIMGIVTVIFTLAGWYHIQGTQAGIGDAIGTLMGGLLLAVGIAVYEEVLFRGILFRLLERGLGSWMALGISALVFGWLHIANPAASWVTSLAIAIEAGVSLVAAYMLTRSLWLPIGLHCGWNFFEGCVFGFNVSGGNTFPALLHSETMGPPLWTGGDFGPGAGLIVVLLWSIVSIVTLLLVIRQGKVVPPAWIRRMQLHPPSQRASFSMRGKAVHGSGQGM